MTGPDLVVLAAGRGTRFGGPKQLVSVRDDGATITDVLVERAAAAGIARAIVVVGPGSEAALRAHLARRDPAIPVAVARQRDPRGTADALLAARDLVADSAVVVNADDVYPDAAFRTIVEHLRTGPADEHALVGFRVGRTRVTARPVSRALLQVDDARLMTVREGEVRDDGGRLRFRAVGAAIEEPLRGDELVSMNCWAFRPAIFDALTAALAEHERRADPAEVLLPDVVTRLVGAGVTVRVLPCDEPCFGLTYRDDLATVRAMLS